MKIPTDLNERVALLEHLFDNECSSKEAALAMALVEQIIERKTKSYYKRRTRWSVTRSMIAEEKAERIFLFIEFIRAIYPRKSMKYAVSAYCRRFSMVEAYRQMRELGISSSKTPANDMNGSREVRDFNRFFLCVKHLQAEGVKESAANIPIDSIMEVYKSKYSYSKDRPFGEGWLKTSKELFYGIQNAISSRYARAYDETRRYS